MISDRLLDEWVDGIGDVRDTVFAEALTKGTRPGTAIEAGAA